MFPANPFGIFSNLKSRKNEFSNGSTKVRKIEEGDLFQSFEYELPYSSGPKYFEARLALFGDEGVMVTVRETTPTVRAYQQLESSENRYRAFLESHTDIIFRKNLDNE